MLNNKHLAANLKAARILRRAFLHIANQYDAETAMVLCRAMDRVDNERRRLRGPKGPRVPLSLVWTAKGQPVYVSIPESE